MSNKSVNASGAVIFWSSASAERQSILGFLSSVGLSASLCPSETSTLDAIKAALTSLYGGRNGRRIEALKGARRGFGALRITDGERDIGGENTLTCELRKTMFSESVDIKFYENVVDEAAERARIYKQIDNERGMVDANGVSDLIAAILGTLAGVRLRERGGVWWIPAGRITALREIRAALYAAVPGCDIGIMTVHVDDDSVKAAISSIRAEAVAITEEVRAKLTANSDTRAINNMKARLESLTSRLTEYEASLGTALPDITGAVAQCQTALLLAQMGDFAGIKW